MIIWIAFGILALHVALLYAWVWQISSCHDQLPRKVSKDDVQSEPKESAPTFISEKWSCELKPKKIRPCRGRKQRKHPARKTRKGRVKWDR